MKANLCMLQSFSLVNILKVKVKFHAFSNIHFVIDHMGYTVCSDVYEITLTTAGYRISSIPNRMRSHIQKLFTESYTDLT